MLDSHNTVVYGPFTAVLCTCIIFSLPKKVTVAECKFFTLSVNHFLIDITIHRHLRDFYVIIFAAKCWKLVLVQVKLL